MKAILGNAYAAQGLLASAQRCVNLYCEINPPDSPFPTTHYQTPGIQTAATVAFATGWRCLYVATTGALYGCIGQNVVRIQPSGSTYTITSLGLISTTISYVSMVDNGISLVIVDGSNQGYAVDMSTDVMTTIADPAFYGSNRVDLLDGYLLLNRPATNQFYISKFLDVDFDALDFAGKTGFSDKIIGVGATKRQLFIFGEQTTEVWFNSGDADFPFARMPGAFIQFGCVTAASICQFDGSLYWLSRSETGEFMVMRTEGYDRARKSTYAIEKALASYSTVEDATAYIYQQDGHPFYVLNFPTADKTWVYDISVDMWHERVWMDEQGGEHRQRANCHAYFNGETLVGDWQSGKLYRQSLDLYTDDGNEMLRLRAFPHMLDDGNRVSYNVFQADMECGEGVPFGQPLPELRLRFSDTKGRSWGTSISNTLGKTGDFLHSCKFTRLGMARDRVFEISWAANCKTSMNGAFVKVTAAAT